MTTTKKKESMKKATDDALDSMFSQTSLKAQNEAETVQTVTSSTESEKAVKKANKPQKEVFCFRADVETVARFRAYCSAKYGMKVDQVGVEAMEEYIEKHPLKDFEEAVYDDRFTEEMVKFKDIQKKREEKAAKEKAARN